jgi:hypothetical protein
MSNLRIPDGFWVAMTVAFAIIGLLLLFSGQWIGAVVAVAAAVWTGFEAAGRGPANRRQPTG